MNLQKADMTTGPEQESHIEIEEHLWILENHRQF